MVEKECEGERDGAPSLDRRLTISGAASSTILAHGSPRGWCEAAAMAKECVCECEGER